MGLSSKLRRLWGNAIDLTIILVEDRIEAWSSNESRSAVQQRLNAAVERGGVLALKVSALEDELDKLLFNGPSLWKDEVEALRLAAHAPGSSGYSPALKQLLSRCDHMPMTAAELDNQVRGIADGTIKTIPWDTSFFSDDDPGTDVDAPWGHDSPPPGYAKCTRLDGHDGPCAHLPLFTTKEYDDDIPF